MNNLSYYYKHLFVFYRKVLSTILYIFKLMRNNHTPYNINIRDYIISSMNYYRIQTKEIKRIK